MSGPRPEALLVDHPSLPRPEPSATRVRLAPVRGQPIARLARARRERAALQLVALTGLLADLDLWPGAAALRSACAVDGADGVIARVDRLPVSLTAVLERLGGGEAAFDRLRESALTSIGMVTGVRPEPVSPDRNLESFFVERHVVGLRRAVDRRIDEVTARALWALVWNCPPLPDTDEVAYWNVPDPGVGRRLAAAALAACRHRDRPAWTWDAGLEGETAPLPPVDAHGLLIVCGRVGDAELAAVDRWARRPDCSAVVLGRFPPGWSPPRPDVFDPDRPANHLVITGLSPESARIEVERRRRRFDPFSEADRRSLTCAVAGLSPRPDHGEDSSRSVVRLLGLAPEGLPAGTLAVHAGARPDDLERLRAAGVAVDHQDRWRLVEQPPLGRDPDHRVVAEALPPADPRRLRHLMLAGDVAAPLVAWIRESLDDLDAAAVRRLIHPVRPDALPREVQALAVEACLADLDLSRAREILAAMSEADGVPWRAWLAALDREPLSVTVDEVESWIDDAPRAAAEVGLRRLRQAVSGEIAADRATWDGIVRRSIDRSAPAVAALLQIERTAVLDPDAFADRERRRDLTGAGHSLETRLLHHRAKRLADLHRPEAARRVLERVRRRLPADAAGWRGLVELDMGSIALEAGRSRVAADHHLRAHRLLEAAGFRSRLAVVQFNLAVSDLDLLRLESAADRLDRCDPSGRDPHTAAERVRLALAKGNLDELGEAARRFRTLTSSAQARLEDGLRWIEGVESLLDGRARAARTSFAHAGDYGAPWQRLADAVVRRAGAPAGPVPSDHWGLGVAAACIGGRPVDDVVGADGDRLENGTALGLALAKHLADDLEIPRRLRRRCASRLQSFGAVGWAHRLRGVGHGEVAALEPVTRIVEVGRPESLSSEHVEQLLTAFDLSGLEARDATTGRALWRWGGGAAGAPATSGRLQLVPLGGELPDGPLWRLVVAVVELTHQDALAPPAIGADAADRMLLGGSEAIDRVRSELRRYAPTAVTVLLRGETGVGKELAARVLHELSGRRGRFVPVNVTTIPESLLEAELFGAMRGAFTGADRSRQGLAVAADEGTLFLDEIGDLGVGLQAKLLRFLDSGEVRPVGATAVRQVDVRIVAATHRDLDARCDAGSFRRDLYFRIAPVTVHLPPLRHRLDDLPALVEMFQHEARVRHGLRVSGWSSDAWDVLRSHEWPGNVRELRHVVEVAMARCDGGPVSPDVLPIGAPGDRPSPATSWHEAHRDFRRHLIVDTLRRHGGNRSAAARALGISRQSLLYHIRNLGIGDDA